MSEEQAKKKNTSTIKRVITGEEGVNNQEILQILEIGIIVVHILMVVIYHLMNVWQLSLYNIIVTAFYSYCFNEVKEGKILKGYLLTFLEINVQMIFSVFIVGWDLGFYTYVIGLIPLYYYLNMFVGGEDDHTFRPLAWSLINVVLFFITYVLSRAFTPMVKLSSVQTSIGFLFNVFFAFQLIIWMSHFFVLIYRKSIVNLEDKNASLDIEASEDPLTKLYNRRTMEASLEKAMEEAKRKGAFFSLVMGDIDFFKKINDTYGHDCGDAALVAVSEILLSCVRDGDMVCRWGGEEFLLLIIGNRDAANAVAERIRQRIEDNVVEYGGNEVKFTMTLGVSTYAPGYALDTLLAQADENLYYGKEHGRNQVVSLKPQVTSTLKKPE